MSTVEGRLIWGGKKGSETSWNMCAIVKGQAVELEHQRRGSKHSQGQTVEGTHSEESLATSLDNEESLTIFG